MQFGNWTITEDTIEWSGDKLNRFVIPKAELNRTRYDKTAETHFYDWILLATAEDWLTENDLYDFNYAFVYAIAKFNLDFDFQIFDNTLAEQYDLFDDEENDTFIL